MIKKLTAIILTVAILVTTCTSLIAGASEKKITQPENLTEYSEFLEQEGYPALTTAQMMSAVKKLNNAYRFLTGRGDVPQEHFNFTVDEILNDICVSIAKDTGLDLLMMTSNLPESNQFTEFIVETFDIDTTALRNEFMSRREEAVAQGKSLESKIYYFLAVYFSVIVECRAYCIPEEGEKNVYEVALDITMRDGTVQKVTTGIMVNTATGEVYDRYGNGLVGTGYNFNIQEALVYTTVTAWTRSFGFCLFYDIFSYVTPFFFYDTRRIKFEYDGLEWMIQIWKGNYLVSNGAEIGIYSRENYKAGSFYDCATDEQMMKMSMELYHGDDLLFSRPETLHWWMTGFRISDTLYPASSMTLRFTIEMQSEEMLKAFCNAIDKHYKKDISYTVDGLTVSVTW
ncbi:MAG: DUF4474 domain-containing protein [Clostridia bacterium]|nr:DUF4474 domain-containing protein [Clostridia bacterium]MBQ3044366.1 DUF4474 domain-containing protein [Clostridia bacterium]